METNTAKPAKPILTKDQRARVQALKEAKTVLIYTKGMMSQGYNGSTGDLVRIAEYILTGRTAKPAKHTGESFTRGDSR